MADSMPGKVMKVSDDEIVEALVCFGDHFDELAEPVINGLEKEVEKLRMLPQQSSLVTSSLTSLRFLEWATSSLNGRNGWERYSTLISAVQPLWWHGEPSVAAAERPRKLST